MKQTFLCLLAMLPGELYARLCAARLLEMDKTGRYLVLSFVCGSIGWLCANRFVPSAASAAGVISTVLLIAITWRFSPKCNKRRSLVISGALYAVMIAVVNITFAIFSQIGFSDTELMNTYSARFPAVCLAASLITVIISKIAVMMMQTISAASTEGVHFWIIAVPAAQAMLLTGAYIYYIYDLKKGEQEQVFLLFLLGATVILILNIFCSVFYQKYLIAWELELQLQQAKKQMETQSAYFEKMQDNILQINQIRHDLKNQIHAARYLLEKGNEQEVRNQLDTLETHIAERVGTRFCPNLMVDAVLCEKAELCKENGLSLKLSVAIPEQIPVENADLCSIFANILDNSIRAAMEKNQKMIPIRLSSDIQRGVLMIRCENPAFPPRKMNQTSPLREHGVGLTILEKLARKYNGQLHTAYQNGSFTLVMMLNLSERVTEQDQNKMNQKY